MTFPHSGDRISEAMKKVIIFKFNLEFYRFYLFNAF